MSAESRELLRSAAAARAQTEPGPLRKQAARSWEARWIAMLSVSAQNAIATTLVQEGIQTLDAPSAPEPLSIDVWLDGDSAWGPPGGGSEDHGND